MQPVLKRKAQAARALSGSIPMGAPRALRLALARSAKSEAGLALSDITVQERQMSLAELLEQPEAHALLAVLEGPGEALGVAVLCPEWLAAVIEAQTTGGVSPAAAPPRKPTRTDAALAAPFIEQTLRAFEALLAQEPDLTWAGGFRYASFLDDPRPLGYVLEEDRYRVFQIRAGLAGAGRQGALLLALPAVGRGPAPAPRPETAAPDAWAHILEAMVMELPLHLGAVLGRISLPLAEAAHLAPGQVLTLPMSALERITLEGPDGAALLTGRLGQACGKRALRLSADMPPPPLSPDGEEEG